MSGTFEPPKQSSMAADAEQPYDDDSLGGHALLQDSQLTEKWNRAMKLKTNGKMSTSRTSVATGRISAATLGLKSSRSPLNNKDDIQDTIDSKLKKISQLKQSSTAVPNESSRKLRNITKESLGIQRNDAGDAESELLAAKLKRAGKVTTDQPAEAQHQRAAVKQLTLGLEVDKQAKESNEKLERTWKKANEMRPKVKAQHNHERTNILQKAIGIETEHKDSMDEAMEEKLNRASEKIRTTGNTRVAHMLLREDSDLGRQPTTDRVLKSKRDSISGREPRLSRTKNVKKQSKQAVTRAKIMENAIGIEKKDEDELDTELEDKLLRADGYLRRTSLKSDGSLGWFHVPKDKEAHKEKDAETLDIDDSSHHLEHPRASITRKPSIVHTHVVLLGAIGQKPKDVPIDTSSRLPPLARAGAA